MKICHVITRMDWSGAPDIVAMICQHQANQGHQVWLITGPSKDLTLKTQKFLKSFSGKVLVVPYLCRQPNIFFDLAGLIFIWIVFVQNRFDQVYGHTAKAGFIARFAAAAAKVKNIIYMPHGHVFYGYFNRVVSRFFIFLEQIAAKISTIIIVLTDLEKHDFILHAKVSPKKIKIVPSGLDFSELELLPSKKIIRQELGLAADKFLVGLVCRLEPVKGADIFVSAALNLASQRQDVCFIIAGQGSLYQKLAAQIKQQGLSGRFKFLGWRDDAYKVIKCLDLLVQPSRNEAVGRVLIEAQAMAVPVVATKVGGIPLVVKDQDTGLLVQSQDVTGLVYAINRILNDSLEYERMSKAAVEWAKQNFTAEKMLEKIDQAVI